MTQGREAPEVSDKTAIELWIKSGARCSFPGCNEYLLTDTNVTNQTVKHGNIAHIVAASKGGARGQHERPMETRSQIDNLMLVCQLHHTLIDDKSKEAMYTVELLQKFKRSHEQRIYELTGCNPDMQSKVIALTARIGAETVSAPYDQICDALFQQDHYPISSDITRIDFTQFKNPDSEAFYPFAKEDIDAQLERVLDGAEREKKAAHVSVFAIGSMPLLVYLGSKISNKISLQLYQRHRDTQTWTWKDEPSFAQFELRMLQEGTDRKSVALLLSLSGTIDHNTIPAQIDEQFFVYEIRLQGTPNPEFLRTPDDLAAFRSKYTMFLAHVRDQHNAATIHLFPAVPAPVAVLCGRELLHKIQPSLTVYDNNKEKGGFEFVLEVH